MKPWIKKIVGFGIASFLSDFSHEMTISLVPVLVMQFVSPAWAPLLLGIISSTSDAFASFLRIIVGFLSDRLSKKKPLIMLGYGVSTFFLVLVGFANSVGEIVVYRMLSFAGNGLREPPRDALIATIIEPANYGRAFGLQRAMDTLGSLVGPLVTFACIGTFSIPMIFVLSFIPGILAVGAIFFFTEDISVSKKTLSFQGSFWHTLLRLPRSFIFFLSIMFIFDACFFNKLLLLARAQEIVIPDLFAVTQSLILLYVMFSFTRACSEFIIGLISDYTNRALLLACFACGPLALVSFLLMTPHASFMYCAGVFALFGITSATTATLKKACAADMLPQEILGLGYGLMQASEGFATLISSSLVGFLWTHYSAYLAFSYVITLSLLSLIALLVFGLTYKNKIS